MPYWIAKKRLTQFQNYRKEFGSTIAEGLGKLKSNLHSSTSGLSNLKI